MLYLWLRRFKYMSHFLIHCPNFLTERNTLPNKITNIDSNVLNQADGTITKTLLFRNSSNPSKPIYIFCMQISTLF